jgi:hypothetical protein
MHALRARPSTMLRLSLVIRTLVLLISPRWPRPPPPVADICWRQDRRRIEHGRRTARANSCAFASPGRPAGILGMDLDARLVNLNVVVPTNIIHLRSLPAPAYLPLQRTPAPSTLPGVSPPAAVVSFSAGAAPTYRSAKRDRARRVALARRAHGRTFCQRRMSQEPASSHYPRVQRGLTPKDD